MLEIIVEIFGELFLQLIVEFCVELLARAWPERWRAPSPPNPFLSFVGYALLGSVLGMLTLWILPHYFIRSPHLRLLNLLATPLIAGFTMSLVGRWRRRHDQILIKLDSFFYGFVFAFSLALVRYCFGQTV